MGLEGPTGAGPRGPPAGSPAPPPPAAPTAKPPRPPGSPPPPAPPGDRYRKSLEPHGITPPGILHRALTRPGLDLEDLLLPPVLEPVRRLVVGGEFRKSGQERRHLIESESIQKGLQRLAARAMGLVGVEDPVDRPRNVL